MLPFRSPFDNAAGFEHLDSVPRNCFMRLCLRHAIRIGQELSINGFGSFSKHHLKMTRVTNERRLLAWMTESKVHIIIQHNDRYHTLNRQRRSTGLRPEKSHRVHLGTSLNMIGKTSNERQSSSRFPGPYSEDSEGNTSASCEERSGCELFRC
jgi:hypothetical protein